MYNSFMNQDIKQAVSVIIHRGDGKVFIAKRKHDRTMPNKWEFPGGKVEASETLAMCAIREIKEETFLNVTLQKYLGYEQVFNGKNQFELHYFTAKLDEENTQIVLSEHSKYQWEEIAYLHKYDLPALQFKTIEKYLQTLSA